MSKSVLICDTPKCCGSCKFNSLNCFKEYEPLCMLSKEYLGDLDLIDDECPLSALDRVINNNTNITDYQKGIYEGWNKHINYLEGIK